MDSAADSVKAASKVNLEVAQKAGLKEAPKADLNADAAEIPKADAAVVALIVEVTAAPKAAENSVAAEAVVDLEDAEAVVVARSSPRQVQHFAPRRASFEAP
ncbi:hypothetical protein [Rhodococcus sp. KBS0724]|uniref:hypothetical protein n=1 Tax=Rhodococcus sp. KBS0724 TaxID=1179674 RepID=UPI00163D59FF|nr:hypothetical protein [Rhodococcus sp. KBS0724]